ncbi:MAG: ABC transporter permease [Lachnospiraceae bacterium]|nr:ABC transporter permease [Lachnospiraceae bacterium]
MREKKLQHRFDTDIVKMTVIAFSILVIMILLNENFAKAGNITSMCFQLPELGLYSLAMMMAMLTDGIDLSVVAIGNLSAICAAKVMHFAVETNVTGAALFGYVLLGILAALLIGAFFGFFNGFVIANLNITPMLATMATSTFIQGISIIITQGHSVAGTPKQFIYFGSSTLLGIPYTMWVLILVFGATAFLLHRTKFGYEAKMVGANPKASHFTGMNIRKVYMKAYLYSGIVSAICGIVILARTDAAKADYATTYVMQAILCSVLGATNPNGGTAKVSCMVLALLSLQFLSSGFNMLHLSSYFKEFTWGLLLIVVLSINFFTGFIRQRRGQHKA